MSDQVYLKVGGRKWYGWTEVSIQQGIDQIAGTFMFRMTGEYHDTARPIVIDSQALVQILADADQVISGYIDAMPFNYDGQSHSVDIEGRDLTGDLVDCCPLSAVKQWAAGTPKLSIIQALARPFGITVRADVTLGNLANPFEHQPTDTAFTTIGSICEDEGVLPIAPGDGTLLLTRAGLLKCDDNLELGVNIKSCSGRLDNASRFSKITVLSQTLSATESVLEAAAATDHIGSAEDDVITRPRPLVLTADKGLNDQQCRLHANWETRVRAGRSRGKTYRVQGWRQSNGKLWPFNALVYVKDEWGGLDGTFLIANVQRVQDANGGTYTDLTVVDPETYTADPTASLKIPKIADNPWQ